ncbi:DUF6542 domain-containing protein [Antrihabitans sp. YC2-6]|uniref:DUF6542 domain-containing protein n=1 Tax=Antrihabitans sp. YC2-6 TaxID=2799498 RepID=UPI0018F6F605|nr:DUF6542 domain-containing protein [Antrihabitans sp. YC2-6]MBJ8343747.1 hypothetical protein [Antrihabitans sp. YC2-6]
MSAAAAVLIGVGGTFLGFLIDSARGDELTRAFSAFYLLSCLAAVVFVRHKGLFTAVVQPPLILFIAVPAAYYSLKDGGTTLKDIVLNAALPLVDRFPLMATTAVLVLLIGMVRVYLAHQTRHAPRAPRARSRTAKPRTQAQRTPTARRSRHGESSSDTGTQRRVRDMPGRDMPRRDIPSRDIPRRDMPSRDVPRRDMPSRDVPRRDMPPRDIPPTTLPPTGMPRSSRSRTPRTNGTPSSRLIPPYTVDDEYTPTPSTRRVASERRYRSDLPSQPIPQVRYRTRDER